MDSDEGKLFVGGIAWDTTEEKLRDYFGQYGDVSQTVIMRDKTTGRPRGFGFVVFSEPSVLDAVLNEKHTIDGRLVEAKRALSKEEQQTSSQIRNLASGRSSGGGGSGGVNFSTKKIFVGGLPSTLTEDAFRQFFESFGQITDVVIMYDQTTQRPRGFGFITFDCEEAVERVLCKNFHELNGKAVEVKRALPKDSNPAAGVPAAGGAPRGYQNYATPTANVYDNHRTMQTQTGGVFAPPYSGYGYGVASSAVGYGGYGAGGYGFGAASYGNPNAPNPVGFVGAMKTAWGGGQAPPAGFGAAGFAPRGPSPSGASGYGYANFAAAGNYGPYAGGYGGRAPGGGDQQGSGGGGYGDSNSGWRSDPSQGGYGGGALSRQV